MSLNQVVDNVGTTFIAVFGTLSFLAFGLHLEFGVQVRDHYILLYSVLEVLNIYMAIILKDTNTKLLNCTQLPPTTCCIKMH